MNKKIIFSMALAAMLAGCATEHQNLTPAVMQRNNTGLYPVEVIVNRAGRGIDNDSIQTSLVVGQQEFPMLRPDVRSNRWEYLLSVPDNVKDVFYHFKVRYQIDYPTKWEEPRKQLFPETAPAQQFQLHVVGNPPPVIAQPPASTGPAVPTIVLDAPLTSDVKVDPATLTLKRGTAANITLTVPKATPAVTGLMLSARTDNDRSILVPEKSIIPALTKSGTVRVQAIGIGQGTITILVHDYGKVVVPFTVTD